MTDPTEPLVEEIARKLAELQIRQARRWDTDPSELEEMMPESVHYSWTDFADQARAILPIIQRREIEAGEKVREADASAVVGYVHPDPEGLLGLLFASATIHALSVHDILKGTSDG